jgi:urea transport system substrate-binding protein
MELTRRELLKGAAAATAGAAAFGSPDIFVRRLTQASAQDKTIKVGILHSLSGTIAIIERSLHNAELLAIDEINAKGGILGKKIEPVIEDPKSEVRFFKEKAEKLLLKDKVVAVLGCYTSASRQSVLPVFEKYNGVLLYPTLYEAQECSYNCFYTGAVPNQQLTDFVPWAIKNIGPKFYLIGSNYIYPKETNREVKALLAKHGGQTVAEEYAPLGHTEFSTNINKMKAAKPNVIFSDLVGDSIVAFYKQFRQFGITAKDIPICTPITTEEEIRAMGPENAVGHYTSFNYFQSLKNPVNDKFVKSFKAKYGADKVTNAVMEAAYFQTYFLAQAIAKLKGGTDPDGLIQEGLPGQQFLAPQGKVKIDEVNHHTWLWARIGRANAEGQFDVVDSSKDWIRPQPWTKVLYPDKDCDFTKVPKGSKSGTITIKG